MKIGLAFFGITRSLKYTIKYIKLNILDILIRNNIEFDIFIHTYKLNTYKNIRTNEFINNIDNEEYKLLNAKYVQIDDQDEIKEKINLPLYRTNADPWETDYNSVDNFILAQYSKSQLVILIEKSNIKYDYIIFLRPDVLYINKFNINFFKHTTDNSICIPNFHLYNLKNDDIKFNDRFCITNMKTYKLYGDIYKYLLDISKIEELHSETILCKLMINYNLKIIYLDFLFLRVRFNGIICKDDIDLFNKKYNENNKVCKIKNVNDIEIFYKLNKKPLFRRK
jgi:hypothetical protein